MPKEIILLGAGASVGAGVPDSYGMTREIASRYEQQYDNERIHLIRFVIGGLLLQKGIRNEDPFSGIDVEEFFNAVLLLAERSTLEAAPFIGSWHDMVERFDRLSPSYYAFDRLNRAIYDSVAKEIIEALTRRPSYTHTSDRVDKLILKAINDAMQAAMKGRSMHMWSSDSVARAIGDYVRSLAEQWTRELKSARPASSEFGREFQKAIAATDVPGEGAVYHTVTQEMTAMLKDIVWIEDPVKVHYIASLFYLLKTQSPLVVATLNYDNSVELAAQTIGLPCSTAVDTWSRTGEFEITDEDIHLLKLHGSIDWAFENGEQTLEHPMPHQAIKQVQSSHVKEQSYRPVVVFGQRNKLTAKGPFLDLLRAFCRRLRDSERLTVIGYSFRDEHINEYISEWLNADQKHTLRIIDPGFSESRVPFAAELVQCCSARLEIISQKAEDGLPMVL